MRSRFKKQIFLRCGLINFIFIACVTERSWLVKELVGAVVTVYDLLLTSCEAALLLKFKMEETLYSRQCVSY